jgi:hypothetical protein
MEKEGRYDGNEELDAFQTHWLSKTLLYHQMADRLYR